MNDENAPTRGAFVESPASQQDNLHKPHGNETDPRGTGYERAVTHPGDVVFDDLRGEQQHGIARGWQLDPTDTGDLVAARRYFNQRSPEDRWHVICASERINGTHEAEAKRIHADADPDTVRAHAKLAAKELPLTELGMARRLVAAYGDTIRHVPQLGLWLVWDGRRWAEDVTGDVIRKAKAVVDELHGEAFRDPANQRDLIRAWQRFQTDAAT